MRKTIIAGNWKMNNDIAEAEALIKGLAEKQSPANCDVVVCPPYICIPAVKAAIEKYGLNAGIGAENLYFEDKGAFTGEISAPMLKSAGVQYVIIGHSERRQYFAETDESVNKKVKKALEYDLIPIICVGETLRQRELGITAEVNSMQIKVALNGLTAEQVAGRNRDERRRKRDHRQHQERRTLRIRRRSRRQDPHTVRRQHEREERG